MKIRSDFVSNSSSSSFIITQANREEFISKFPNRKLIKLKEVNDIIEQLKKMTSEVNNKFKELCGDEYIYMQLFEPIRYSLEDLNNECDKMTTDINDILTESNYNLNDIEISTPIDRDRAYMLNFRAQLFKGDL